MGLNTSDYQEYAPGKTGSADYYGDADYNRDKAAGMSDAAILSQINADPSKMGDGGVGGNLYNRISAGANSGGGGGGQPSGGYTGGTIGAGAGAYNPPDVNFNPGGIDMNSSVEDDLARSIAKERAVRRLEGVNNITETNTITNDVEQNIGNKGDMFTTFGDNATISNSAIGNDYSLNLGSLNIANRIA